MPQPCSPGEAEGRTRGSEATTPEPIPRVRFAYPGYVNRFHVSECRNLPTARNRLGPYQSQNPVTVKVSRARPMIEV